MKNMKKVCAILLGLGLTVAASAQGFGSRMADLDLDREIGDSPFSYEVLSYIHFGFNGLLNPDAEVSKAKTFVRSQEFGFNVAELAFAPYSGGRISVGADVAWKWFRLTGGYYWWPHNVNVPHMQVENARLVRIGSVATDGYYVKEVKRSTLTVCTFRFPLDFAHQIGKVTLNVGAAFEINLNACSRFRGVGMDGSTIKDTSSGLRYSKNITTYRYSYNVHASVSYGGLGIYGRYSPVPVLGEGFGPQFSTWTAGLVVGLGM